MKTLYESLRESLCENFFDNVGGSSFNLIDNWCKNNIEGKYVINKKTLTINSPSSIKITNKELTEFPSYIHFGIVNGSFSCDNCDSLKSLEGAPKEVGRGFNCNECGSLESLDDISTRVKGEIYSDIR